MTSIFVCLCFCEVTKTNGHRHFRWKNQREKNQEGKKVNLPLVELYSDPFVTDIEEFPYLIQNNGNIEVTDRVSSNRYLRTHYFLTHLLIFIIKFIYL